MTIHYLNTDRGMLAIRLRPEPPVVARTDGGVGNLPAAHSPQTALV